MLHTNIHTTTNSYLNSYRSFSLFILLALLSLPALSKPFAAGGQPSDLHLQRMADRLELSQQQRAELKTIMSAAKIAGVPTGDAMQANREALKRVLSSSSPDQAQIQALAESQGDLLTESLLQKAATLQQINTMLTAEQRIKMQAYKEARQDMRASRKNKRAQKKSQQNR